ncbi:hypothetical protein AB0D38_17840 [Streptomyces sp. NPDC048279]|uniref:hypothetical protein n=1 Tax=Streptomyces sp. NPDC048279 TaxID=3154714 RepID=UPI0034357F2C
MGVFTRFLGKKPKVTEEPDTEAPATAEPDGFATENTPEGAAENMAEEAAGASVAKGPGEDGGGSVAARTTPEPVAATSAESTEIPQQQSAKEAADNEVGEGART